jgi:hypothetical protein
MQIAPLLKSEVIYARDIVKAGLDASASVGKSDELARVSQSALAPAALGAAIGVLGVVLGRKGLERRGRLGNAAVLGGVVGCALGFTGGFAWGTRKRTKDYCLTAAQNVQAVRDAHWLKKNPIAYA